MIYSKKQKVGGFAFFSLIFSFLISASFMKGAVRGGYVPKESPYVASYEYEDAWEMQPKKKKSSLVGRLFNYVDWVFFGVIGRLPSMALFGFFVWIFKGLYKGAKKEKLIGEESKSIDLASIKNLLLNEGERYKENLLDFQADIQKKADRSYAEAASGIFEGCFLHWIREFLTLPFLFIEFSK